MKLVLGESLVCHPVQSPGEVSVVEASLWIGESGAARLLFSIHAPSGYVRIAAPRPPRRTDGLWRHTCAELFVAVADRPAYDEFNFAPSGEWACYHFQDYRLRDDRPGLESRPQIVTSQSADQTLIEVTLPSANLPEQPELQIGISMIIETNDGRLSYWAMRHPAAVPDFHHRKGFTAVTIESVEAKCAPG
jgi:hypothetical protein